MTEGYQLIESGIILLKSYEELQEPLTLETENIIRGRINNDSTQPVLRTQDKRGGRCYLVWKGVLNL